MFKSFFNILICIFISYSLYSFAETGKEIVTIVKPPKEALKENKLEEIKQLKKEIEKNEKELKKTSKQSQKISLTLPEKKVELETQSLKVEKKVKKEKVQKKIAEKKVVVEKTKNKEPLEQMSSEITDNSKKVLVTEEKSIVTEKKVTTKTSSVKYTKLMKKLPCNIVATEEFCNEFISNNPKMFESKYGFSYTYNKSESNFSHRNYETKIPGVQYELDVWLTPFAGLFGSYYYTIVGSLLSQPVGEKAGKDIPQNAKPYRINNFRLGLHARIPLKYKKNSYIKAQLGYVQEHMDASEVAGRVSVQSKSFETALETSINHSEEYQTLLGVNLIYDMSRKEFSKDNIKSGANGSTYKMAAHLGGLLKAHESHKVFWKMRFKNYSSLYKGNTNIKDPYLGKKIEGVSVTNQYYDLIIGYQISH